MAKSKGEKKKLNIRQACTAFSISQSCYRYQPKLSTENMLIADWLVRLTVQATHCREGDAWHNVFTEGIIGIHRDHKLYQHKTVKLWNRWLTKIIGVKAEQKFDCNPPLLVGVWQQEESLMIWSSKSELQWLRK